jgi:hypothetical protein
LFLLPGTCGAASTAVKRVDVKRRLFSEQEVV